MAGDAARRGPVHPSAGDAALSDPVHTVPAALLGALVVTLTGIVLGNLPSLDAMRDDHGLVPATVDELARSGVLVLAAVAGLAGRRTWRRWAAAVAGLHTVEVSLAWALDSGPVGLADAVVWRAVTAAGLAGVLARSARPAWLGAGRWWAAGLLVLAAGASALGGLRGTVPAGAVGGALADGVRTGAGVAVTVVAVLTALVTLWVADRRLAGMHTTTAGLVAAASVAGDAARWLGESRRGPVAVLAARGGVALVTLAVGVVLAGRRGPARSAAHRPRRPVR